MVVVFGLCGWISVICVIIFILRLVLVSDNVLLVICNSRLLRIGSVGWLFNGLFICCSGFNKCLCFMVNFIGLWW